jgi:L-aminopeptidase/D-esterase-like protein
MHKVLPQSLDSAWGLPVAAETYDGFLNDINGHHVTAESVFAALDDASRGPIDEGSVGGGTGMIAFGFKAGSGTASRVVRRGERAWTVGAFVQANFGDLKNFSIRGRRFGAELAPLLAEARERTEKSSIIAVIATDAPFLPHQMKRLARRVPLGIALTGGFGYHSSGDIFLAFSTANTPALRAGKGETAQAAFVPDVDINPFFDAVIQSVEEAILNAMVVNEDMRGRDGNFVPALPKAWLREKFGAAG